MRRQRLQDWTMSIGRTLRVAVGIWVTGCLTEGFQRNKSQRRLAMWEKHMETPIKNGFLFATHLLCEHVHAIMFTDASTAHRRLVLLAFCCDFFEKTWGPGTLEEPCCCARTKVWDKKVYGNKFKCTPIEAMYIGGWSQLASPDLLKPSKVATHNYPESNRRRLTTTPTAKPQPKVRARRRRAD